MACPKYLIGSLADRAIQINPMGICGVILGLWTFGREIRGRRFLVFINNQAALGAIKKGRSPVPDFNELVFYTRFVCADHSVEPSFMWVPSELNWSDAPSRGSPPLSGDWVPPVTKWQILAASHPGKRKDSLGSDDSCALPPLFSTPRPSFPLSPLRRTLGYRRPAFRVAQIGMEGSLLFFERHGFNGIRDILRAARLGPYTSVVDIAALPNSVIYSSGKDKETKTVISARDLAREACGHCLDFKDERHGFFTRHVPGAVGGAILAPGWTFSESTRLTRPRSTTGSGSNPLEHIASGHEVSAWDVEASFMWVFDESAAVAGSVKHAHVRPDGLRAYTFSDRCKASGCRNLIPRISLDEGIKGASYRDGLPPTKRMRRERDELNSRTPDSLALDRRAARLPQLTSPSRPPSGRSSPRSRSLGRLIGRESHPTLSS